MKIWASLYLMVWLAFFEFMSVFAEKYGLALSVEVHILLGVVTLALAFNNLAKVKVTDAPSRIKRILKATVGFAVFQAILGMLLFLNSEVVLIPFTGAIDFLHLAVALAMIAQASSVATSYDMWEEKEFIQTSKLEWSR